MSKLVYTLAFIGGLWLVLAIIMYFGRQFLNLEKKQQERAKNDGNNKKIP